MSPYTFAAIVILVFEMLLASQASACGRCGIFGRGCRFAHAPVVHHAAPAIVKAPDTIQNFVFNNISPPGDLAPRGATVYGLSRALEYNAPNSALYLDNARRALEFAGDTTVSARTIDTLTLDAAAIDARGRAVEAAFRSLAPDTATATRSTTTKVTIRNGIPVIDELPTLPALPAQDDPPPVPRDLPLRPVDNVTCMRCHGKEGVAASEFLLDGPLTLEQFAKAKDAIEAGRMPPKTNLTPAEKLSLVARFGKLVRQ